MDMTQVQDAWSVIAQASSALWTRWQFWLKDIGKHATVNDALVRNMIWSFVMWCFAAWMGWFAARRNAILALLPGIVLMAVILSYSEYRIDSLWMMVIIMLLLMGVWNYKNHTTQWERRRVDYSDSIVYDNAQAVVFMALLIGSIASWAIIHLLVRNPGRTLIVIKTRQPKFLAFANRLLQRKIHSIKLPRCPREHVLTEGFAQSQELVMTILYGRNTAGHNPFRWR